MGKNRMAEIAESFGKRFGQEFTVMTAYGDKAYCRFMRFGLYYVNPQFDWEKAETLLDDLLAGRAKIIGE